MDEFDLSLFNTVSGAPDEFYIDLSIYNITPEIWNGLLPTEQELELREWRVAQWNQSLREAGTSGA